MKFLPILVLFLSILPANNLSAQAIDYFPLAVGNQWVYKHEHFHSDSQRQPILDYADTLTISVQDTLSINSKLY